MGVRVIAPFNGRHASCPPVPPEVYVLVTNLPREVRYIFGFGKGIEVLA